MTCNCKKDIEEKLTADFIAREPKGAGHSVELQGYGFGMSGSTLVVQGVMPYKSTAVFPLVKGGAKSRTVVGNMVFNFCPFCGEKAR